MVPARTLSRDFMAVVRSLRRRSFSVSVMSTSLAARSNAFGRLVACSSCLAPIRTFVAPPRSSVAWPRSAQAALRTRTLWEVDAYRLRRVYVPVLPTGARSIRVLQISDLHLTPRNAARQRWLASLAGLEPDLVVDTGDNISHRDAVPLVTESLGRLLDLPGVFVWGSNDYYAPSFKNPLTYLVRSSDGRAPGQGDAALGRPPRPVRSGRLDRPDPRPDHDARSRGSGSSSAAPTTHISASTSTPTSPARSTGRRSTCRSVSPTRPTGG